MTYLVTGAAGFIGFHVAHRLLMRGERVVGIDNLNAYYSVRLKEARLAELREHPGFVFQRLDVEDLEAMRSVMARETVAKIIHLAAEVGVRSSLVRPHDYVRTNVAGHLNMLELHRETSGVEHMVYASSSSIYGAGATAPFSEAERADTPVSLYAATKRADELMSHSYAHLYGLPLTGLRFFTVYGPWSRPDMAIWSFTQAILERRPIEVFNEGAMRRDFTYVDDVVSAVLAAIETPPDRAGGPPHRVYNVASGRPVELGFLIDCLEGALGRKADRRLLPMQPGDMVETSADIGAIEADLGYRPRTTLEDGLVLFADWYRRFHGYV